MPNQIQWSIKPLAVVDNLNGDISEPSAEISGQMTQISKVCPNWQDMFDASNVTISTFELVSKCYFEIDTHIAKDQ